MCVLYNVLSTFLKHKKSNKVEPLNLFCNTSYCCFKCKISIQHNCCIRLYFTIFYSATLTIENESEQNLNLNSKYYSKIILTLNFKVCAAS